VPETIEAQAEACWRNIIAILADAGMGVQDLVKITTYLVRPEGLCTKMGNLRGIFEQLSILHINGPARVCEGPARTLRRGGRLAGVRRAPLDLAAVL
jgi:enamine deaminase RidA (YjgF/YER057c/UK114 family)